MEPTIELQCSKVLSLSYDYLPVYLKPCYLYVMLFPEDSRIKDDRLIRLWIAEGFVEQSGSKCVEEVAEGYIDDLVGRSLLLVSRRKSDGRIKTDDLLREFGTLRVQKERFYYCNSLESMAYKQQRRLSVHSASDLYSFLSVQDPMTRSLLDFSSSGHTKFPTFRLLKDTDTEPIKLSQKQVAHLRYLAISHDKDLLESLPEVLNLQTLCTFGWKMAKPDFVVQLPLKVWKMLSLRHVNTISPFHLELPSDNEIVEESNLQTLSTVANLELSSKMIVMLANLKKLGLYYYMADGAGVQNDYQLSNLVRLWKIEELEIMFDNLEWSSILEVKFPSSLKKLTFGCHDPSGDDTNVAVVDFLPNVEVLKLKGDVYTNGEWTPVEGQFEKLRYLELSSVNLKHWEAESIHFPSLEVLVLRLMGDELKGDTK